MLSERLAANSRYHGYDQGPLCILQQSTSGALGCLSSPVQALSSRIPKYMKGEVVYNSLEQSSITWWAAIDCILQQASRQNFECF